MTFAWRPRALYYFACSSENFCGCFLRICLGIWYWRMAEIFGEFLWSPLLKKQSTKSPRKFRGNLRAFFRARNVRKRELLQKCSTFKVYLHRLRDSWRHRHLGLPSRNHQKQRILLNNRTNFSHEVCCTQVWCRRSMYRTMKTIPGQLFQLGHAGVLMLTS